MVLPAENEHRAEGPCHFGFNWLNNCILQDWFYDCWLVVVMPQKNLTVLKPKVAGTLGPVFIFCRQNHFMPYML
jgi:hypothetical protein